MYAQTENQNCYNLSRWGVIYGEITTTIDY